MSRSPTLWDTDVTIKCIHSSAGISESICPEHTSYNSKDWTRA